MKIGDPLDRSTSHGPQNHRAHFEKLMEYCEIGIKEGATLIYGGKQVDRPGKDFMIFDIRGNANYEQTCVQKVRTQLLCTKFMYHYTLLLLHNKFSWVFFLHQILN